MIIIKQYPSHVHTHDMPTGRKLFLTIREKKESRVRIADLHYCENFDARRTHYSRLVAVDQTKVLCGHVSYIRPNHLLYKREIYHDHID